MKPTITIRVTEAERMDWTADANAQGRSLSNWIRARCNARVGVVTMPDEAKISETAVEVERREVARNHGTLGKIEDVTHATARKSFTMSAPRSEALPKREPKKEKHLAVGKKGKRPPLCDHNFYVGACPKGC